MLPNLEEEAPGRWADGRLRSGPYTESTLVWIRFTLRGDALVCWIRTSRNILEAIRAAFGEAAHLGRRALHGGI